VIFPAVTAAGEHAAGSSVPCSTVPERIRVLVDKPRERISGRSSSAAKKAEAPRRISLARRSSFTSARSSLISADSSLLGYVIVAHGRSDGWHGWVTGGW
jgi:hypothetical protein